MATKLNAEQKAKVKEARQAAAIENGVKARIARRTLKAEQARGNKDQIDQAKEAAEKAQSREAMTVNLWDADGDGDVDELDRQIIEAYLNTTKSWLSSGEDTWLRHLSRS